MSLRMKSIPKGASMIRQIQGTINSEGAPNHGKSVTIRFLAAFVSDGWKSDYTAHQAYYLVVLVADSKPWAKRFSGNNLVKAEQFWGEMASIINAA